MFDHELPGRPQSQQHEHAAVAAIAESAPWGESSIFRERERAHVAELAAIEISRRAMMNGVRLLPVAEREQRDQAEAGADPVVRPPAREVRAVAAVVLN